MEWLSTAVSEPDSSGPRLQSRRQQSNFKGLLSACTPWLFNGFHHIYGAAHICGSAAQFAIGCLRLNRSQVLRRKWHHLTHCRHALHSGCSLSCHWWDCAKDLKESNWRAASLCCLREHVSCRKLPGNKQNRVVLQSWTVPVLQELLGCARDHQKWGEFSYRCLLGCCGSARLCARPSARLNRARSAVRWPRPPGSAASAAPPIRCLRPVGHRIIYPFIPFLHYQNPKTISLKIWRWPRPPTGSAASAAPPTRCLHPAPHHTYISYPFYPLFSFRTLNSRLWNFKMPRRHWQYRQLHPLAVSILRTSHPSLTLSIPFLHI